MLIAYAPHHERDETLYSVVARTVRLSALRQTKSLLAAWSGEEYSVLSTDIPTRLKTLQGAWGPSFYWRDTAELLESATVWPYHRPFLSPEKATTVVELMHAGAATGLKTYVGRVANGFGACPSLRFCVWCAENDAKRLGLPVWRRAHQLPGVRICQEHGVALREQRAPLSAGHAAVNPMLPLDPVPTTTCALGKRSWPLARLSADLLTAGLPAIHPRALSHAYRAGLRDAGFSSREGSIRFGKLAIELGEHHDWFSGYEHQRRLMSSEKAPLRWLQTLVHRPATSSHPICHCLLIDFLFGSIPRFVAALPRHETLERQSFKATSVEAITDEWRSVEAPKALASSPSTRSRSQLAHPVDERWWAQPLNGKPAGLLEDLYLGIGPVEAAKRNDVSLSSAYRAIPSKNFLLARERGERLIRRRAYQALWLRYMNAAHGKVNSARRRLPEHYAWLYRDDQNWLRACNARFAHLARPPARGSLIDWARRDSALAGLLADVVAETDYNNVRRRVSSSFLLKSIGYETQFRISKAKLPMLSQLLEASVQPPAAFQLMRIASAINEIQKLNLPVTRWRVERRAGLRKPHADVLTYLDTEFRELVTAGQPSSQAART